MREFPRGGFIGKTVHLWRRVSGLRVPLYAANASFFLILAVFPGLLLLLGSHARPYPNAADRSYFMGKLLDAITSTVTGMGVITILFFLMTM